MANKNINARVSLKHDVEANWIAAGKATNPFIPLHSEIIFYDIEKENDPLPAGRTKRYTYRRKKIGDGIHNVNELPFEKELFYSEQTLTTTEKTQARENIGAGRTTLIVNDEEIEYYTPIGTQGSATGAEIFNDYYSNQALGEYSHAEGLSTEASGARSHAEGDTTHATAMASHAEGADTHAEGIASHAEGYGTCATGDYSHAEGYTSEASGDYSHAEGYHAVASDSYAHAEGEETTASGYDSHAEGYDSEASGQASHAEGYCTSAEGDYSHAENYFTTASSDYAHAEGYWTTASGDASHAEGASTVASGTEAHAEGWQTVASGRESHAEGEGTIANSYAQHAQGKYNIEDAEDTYAHIVGNGDSENRSNAHTLDWSGNAWYQGEIKIGGTGYNDPNAKRLSTSVDLETKLDIPDNVTHGAIMIFDKSKNRLVDSGYTIDGFKQWVKDYIELYMSTGIEKNEAGGETLTINTKNYTEENGTLIIGG